MIQVGGRPIAGIGLGTAPLAFRGGTDAEAVATVHAALDAGVRLVDTALAYTRVGVESYAEYIVACALRGRRGDLLPDGNGAAAHPMARDAAARYGV